MPARGLGLSSEIRRLALKAYIEPALEAGKDEFSIAIRDLMRTAEENGPDTLQRTPAFCHSIQKAEFLRENALEIKGVDGPPSKKGTSVVVHYRVLGAHGDTSKSGALESPQQRAHRLTEALRGLLKKELAEYGGGEAFIRWIRSEGDERA